MKKTTKKSSAFDTNGIDNSVRPQDDFYHYSNGGWIKKNKIPQHEASWGSFLELRYKTEKDIRSIVLGLEDKTGLKKGSNKQMVRDFYKSGMDTKLRNKIGLSPIQPWIDDINKITDKKSLISTFAKFEETTGGAPWGVAIEQDMKNSSKYITHIYQDGIGMPDRDYYLKDDKETLRIRTAYEKHIESLLSAVGYTKEKSISARKTIMRIETGIAKASVRKEDLRDSDKMYHKMSISELNKLTPAIEWKQYLNTVGAKNVRNVVVMQPTFLKKVSVLINKESLEDWKTYLEFGIIKSTSSVLTTKLETINFEFYSKTLMGTQKIKPLWRRVLNSVNSSLSDVLGELYVEKHFTPESKAKIIDVADDLFEAYENRINNLDWMSKSTKQKAVQKLHKMNRKFGYPDKWRSYKGIDILPEDYFGNIIRITKFEHKRIISRLQKPVDPKEWFMSPQTVNAYCSFEMNDVVFPAAILQPPFFHVDSDDALNYGAMGSVIGHEITHGFDDQGSKFDGNGNRKTWWKEEDLTRFTKKTKVLIKQFNKYSVADGVKVNGQLTLGENIADLGGASIAYDAYKIRLKKTGKENIKGLTSEQRFFVAFAIFERELIRPEAQKTHAINDPHSPGIFRINGPMSNIPEFYEAFDVKSGDKMYRKPQDRAKIW